ncbi:MAG: hypothetical protein E7521_01970 [Ruminococcaceae bacterium]|nr:hypothetical protein [Oscillospiraceae bacterium]
MGFFSKRKDENNGFIINTDDEPIKISGDQNLAPHAMTPDEVSNLWIFGDDESNVTQTGALDSLKKRMNVSATVPQSEESKEPASKPNSNNLDKTTQHIDNQEDNSHKTLVEKVKRYTIDEHGKDASENNEPLYHLESVAEILMSDGESAMKSLSEKYGIDINNTDTNSEEPTKPSFSEKTNSAIKPTVAFEKMVIESEKRETQEMFDNLFTDNKKLEEIPDASVPNISDIDNKEVGITTPGEMSNTATIRFTPVKDTKGNTDHITISSSTRHIDLGEDYVEDISSQSPLQSFEQSEFEKFTPKNEITDIASGKKIMRELAIKKRSGFISVFVSALSVIALLVFLLPPIFDFIIAKPKNAMFTCGAFLLLSVVANINMFFDLKNLVSKQCGFDAIAALGAIFSLSLTVCAALTDANAYYMILLCAIILLMRAICNFKEISYKIGNLKQILNNSDKKAITLIDDPATTFAMAKNTIDGDVLIAAPRKTVLLSDYIKHTEFAPKLSGKGPFMFYFSLVFSVLCGIIAYFYYQSIFDAFYSAAVVSCVTAIPTLFFIDSLPLSVASKKLNSKGSMIAGMYGAERLDLTNAAVVHINDIFPTGSIKMYSMKVLSNNNIDDTILRAASLTAAVKSPLEAIFNQIAGTNSSYTIPDSDTVKYEKNLGISGWVNNELLFIGNRSFMQAHGIQIPSLEIDKKILRNGYFPVYVATTDTACALIIIQYEARTEIAKELRKITNLGLTLLVENCDPNITEEMICDYFDLYEGSVKVMSNAGVYMLKNITPDVSICSAPAAYRGSQLNLVKIINCASMIIRSNKLLTIMYILFAIFGIMYFVYASFSGFMSMPQASTVLLYALGTTVLSIIGFLIRKP